MNLQTQEGNSSPNGAALIEGPSNTNAADPKKAIIEAKTKAHLEACFKEKQNLSNIAFPIASRLLSEEIQRTQETGKATFDHRYVDLCHGRPTKVIAKILIPFQEAPHYNFVGKILGPKGQTLKALSEASKCRILILGRGSMRDKNKEDELRSTCDPKYAHLFEELHIEVSCVAPADEAHERVAYALKELRVLLLPESPFLPPMSGHDATYVPRGGGAMGPRAPRLPPPAVSAANSAKVMSLLEKARNAMEFAPPRRFLGPRRFITPHPIPAAPIVEYDDAEYEEPIPSPGQWRPSFKAPGPSRFFPTRSAPYGRP